MAKRFKQQVFLQEIADVEEIVEEEPKFLVEEEEPERKMDKQEFLDSIGLGERPGSQLAITKWEEYRRN